MMTLTDRINNDLTAAMKARESVRMDVLRMAKMALHNRALHRRAVLDGAEEVQVLQGLVKQREDAIEQYQRGGRPELAAKEQAEIEILRGYLPSQASAEDIAAALEQAVTETGGATLKDMGKVMKATMALLKAAGKPADGKLVNEAVKRRLGG